MPSKLMGNFFKLVLRVLKYSIVRSVQRFQVEGRSKKYLGEEAKYFKPAPRAIGSLTQIGVSQYPHLENLGRFKSVAERRREAILARNQRLLENSDPTSQNSANAEKSPETCRNSGLSQKAFSEIKQDDNLVIETSSRLPVIKTISLMRIGKPKELGTNSDHDLVETKSSRSLPKLTNLQLSDPSVIWHVNKVPIGRLDLSKLQELMINKLADDAYWTPKQISDTYNIKEAYAENLISYLKQIRIIISPLMKNSLDEVGINDPTYQATKHIIYHVDYSLRSEKERAFDETFLPTDDLEPEVRKVLEGGKLQEQKQPPPNPSLTLLFKRPKPLKLDSSKEYRKVSLQEDAFIVKQRGAKQLNAKSTVTPIQKVDNKG